MTTLVSTPTQSLDRPAWTQDDLHAYRHKHLRTHIVPNYYTKYHNQLRKRDK